MIIQTILISFFSLCIKKIISSPKYDIHRIIINDDVNNMEKTSYQFFHKGMILTFDPNLSYSIIPLQIENEMKNGFYSIVEYSDPYEIDVENGNKALITHIYDPVCFSAINFILDDKGIKIPSEFLFKKKNDVYEFIFLMNENQDKVVFGKDLIDLMKIEFIGENNFIIHNKTFEISLNDY